MVKFFQNLYIDLYEMEDILIFNDPISVRLKDIFFFKTQYIRVNL